MGSNNTLVYSGLSMFRQKFAWVLNVCMDVVVATIFVFMLYNIHIGRLFIGHYMKIYVVLNLCYIIYSYNIYCIWTFKKAIDGYQPFCDRIAKCILMFFIEVFGFLIWTI